MTHNSDLGREGEEFAAGYLKRQGYWIQERNWKRPFGELDIVAIAPDKTLVFIEVKTTRPGSFEPEEEMTSEKIKKFRRAAALFAGARSDLVDDEHGWRLDAIAVEKRGDGSFAVRHYENI
ncbi:YraN family protein [Patescibacteria group bacterium]|nr:YraN family protein [Patescibacteria group bacterium]